MRVFPIRSAVILALAAADCAAQESGDVDAAQRCKDIDMSAVETFSDADSLRQWSFSNGREWPGARGSLEWHANAGRAADGAAALSYNFEDGGHYVAAIVKLPQKREVKAVRLWVNKPAANLMIFRARDADGEVFQKNLRYHYPGWQQLEISLGGWEFSWGGDGTFRAPPREFHILVENDGGNRVGTVLLDDLQWVFEPTPAGQGGVAQTVYIESDFIDAERWRYDGAPGGGFSDGRWRYRFTAERTARPSAATKPSRAVPGPVRREDTPALLRTRLARESSRTATKSTVCSTDVRLVRDRGILGRPQKMMLTIESDGSGHELVARIGSHFQLFERSLGTVDTKGPTTFEVPLGDMTTWRHFAGENDGIVRYPLRLMNLALVRKGERDRGSLELRRLEFDTEYDRDSETVWVIPSVGARDGETARFNVELRSLAEEPLRGSLDWSLHTADRQLRRGSQALELPARGTPITTQIEGQWSDASVLEGRFRFRADHVASRQAATTIARIPPAEPDRTLNPASRMGVGMYLYRFHGHPEAKQWMERWCDLAARAGVKWTREEFHWNWIQPQRGEYDFEFFDQLVETTQNHGISVYALCCYWTSWTKPYSDEGIEDYCRYLETLVRRYGDRIKHWEIWNEPNVFFWSGPKKLYAKLLSRAYETIKRVDPEAQVLGCSTAGIDTSFIQMVLSADAPFDALTVHPYRGTLDPRGFIGELRVAHKLAGGRDVWITEMGWPSQIGGLSEREQAQHVARTYICALASGVARSVAWYDFREDGADPFYNEHHFGLVRHDLTPKMGYLTLATVGRLLGSAEFEKELSLRSYLPPQGDDLVGFLFRNGQQRVAAIWSPNRTRMATFNLEGKKLRILNATGDPLRAVRGGRYITLLERDMPIYIMADGELGIDWREFPLAIRLDKPAVHPGETITYDTSLDAMTNFDVDELPPSWTSGHVAGKGSPITITVPADASPGQYTVTHRVKTMRTDTVFILPVEIEVAPLLLRG